MASLDRRDASTKAHGILASKGYTRGTDPSLFTSGANQVRLHTDNGHVGLAQKVKNSNGSETLLMTFRLLDDQQTDMANNT